MSKTYKAKIDREYAIKVDKTNKHRKERKLNKKYVKVIDKYLI